MRKLSLALSGFLVMLWGALGATQELPDLLQGTSGKVKYGYTHEVFSQGEQARVEDWLHLRLGDLTGSLEMRKRDQHKITLNSSVGRLLNIAPVGWFGKMLDKLQVEGRSETRRADWVLLGIELPIMKKINLYLAGVANDAGAKRVLFGPMLYWAPHSYTSVLLYPGSELASDNGAIQLRNHMDFDSLWVEANGLVKVVDHSRYFGISGKVGWGPVAVKLEQAPKYEGGKWDRMLTGLDFSLDF